VRALCAEVKALRTENRSLRHTASRAEHFEGKYRRYKVKAANGARYKQTAKQYRLMLAGVGKHTAALVEHVAAASNHATLAAQEGQLADDDFAWASDSGPDTESESEPGAPRGDQSSFDWSDAEDYA
jgi:hypothetical protein